MSMRRCPCQLKQFVKMRQVPGPVQLHRRVEVQQPGMSMGISGQPYSPKSTGKVYPGSGHVHPRLEAAK